MRYYLSFLLSFSLLFSTGALAASADDYEWNPSQFLPPGYVETPSACNLIDNGATLLCKVTAQQVPLMGPLPPECEVVSLDEVAFIFKCSQSGATNPSGQTDEVTSVIEAGTTITTDPVTGKQLTVMEPTAGEPWRGALMTGFQPRARKLYWLSRVDIDSLSLLDLSAPDRRLLRSKLNRGTVVVHVTRSTRVVQGKRVIKGLAARRALRHADEVIVRLRLTTRGDNRFVLVAEKITIAPS